MRDELYERNAMKALTYHGARDVRVETVPDPAIVEQDDIILRTTATAICGSDLHIFRGKIPMVKDGDILGHEFMGIVEEVGPAVSRINPGDRVVVPFTISCGDCFFCSRSLYAACENTNPGRGALMIRKQIRSGAGMFGYSHLYGGYAGGQAEYVRVPKANVGPLVIPDSSLPDDKVLFLSDILPTGYQAAMNAGIKEGSSVAIFGAGPVGLMAAAASLLLGAERIFMVDHHQYRLDYARQAYGVEPINFSESADAAEIIVALTDRRGVDGAIDAVGFEAKGSVLETALTNLKVETASGKALRQAIGCTRRGGTVSVPGVYAGFIHGFLIGDVFDKGLTIKCGQTHVQGLMPELLDHISNGRLKPEAIITHRMPLDEAARGYQIFNNKEQNCRKVVLTPAGAA